MDRVRSQSGRKESTRRLLWGLFVAVLIGFVAAVPLIRGLPESAGHLLHLYRAVHLADLVQNGILYSRWLPELGFGFGYPLFNYYAPLSYYLVELLDLLGLSLIEAYLAIFMLAFVSASLFTYLWVDSVFDEPAALVAAAAYTFSPYLLETGNQGALAEIVALAFLPIILWSFHQVMMKRRWYYGLAAVLSYASLILSHNITALIFTSVLIAYVLIVGFTQTIGSKNRLRSIIQQVTPAFALILLALALSAFFWLPALVEKDLVQIDQVVNPNHFNYDANFLLPNELLALPFVSDPNLVFNPVPNSISLITLIMGLIGLASAGLFRNQPQQLAHILLAGIVVIGSALMTLSVSEGIWEHVLLLSFLQFPARFLALTTLFFSMLSGVGTSSLICILRDKNWLAVTIPVFIIAAVALYAIPWQFVDYFTPQPSATISSSAEFERRSGAVGTTSTGEYLPVSVLELPPDRLETVLGNDRFDLSSLPDGAQIKVADYQPLSYELKINSPIAFLAVFNTFYFQGWRAMIDGNPAEIKPTKPYGLISVELPQGKHELAIIFESTPIRTISSVVSWISLLLMMPVILLLYRGKSKTDLKSTTFLDQRVLVIPMILVLLIVMVIKIAYLDRSESIARRSNFDGQSVINAKRQIFANFDNQMMLLGADIPEIVAADTQVVITLYWRVTDQIEREFSVSAVLVDSQNNVVGQSDNQHPGVIPTTDWQVDEYAADEHQINLIPGTPPGIYDVQVIVYDYGRPENRLNLLDKEGAPAGQIFSLGSLKVDRPVHPSEIDELNPRRRINKPFFDGLSLVGYSLPEYAIGAGDPLYLELFWQATDDIEEDLEVLIELSDATDQVDHSEILSPITGFPTSLWQPGDLWRALHRVILPAGLNSGDYDIRIQIGEDERIPLGMVQITAPDHLMIEPPFVYPDGTRFGEVAQLVGYDLPLDASPGNEIPIRLIWKAIGESQKSYKVFVQLLDNDGRLVTGSDAIPANWERPTTGWIFGEYVVDAHTLSLPADLLPGNYKLLVGLYDAGNLQRLPMTGGDDALILSQGIEIQK